MQRPAREAALALEEMLKDLLPTPAEAPEPTNAHQPLPSARYTRDAPDEAARRRARAELLVARCLNPKSRKSGRS
ncbi:hypothetical protein X753_00380 [Mesorhizobium sp. LNJC399B00]|nr:hypothetical protein X753_00380 [Mesorhizobium sp. LNJC399B00]ESZ43660.1 hypothetical protein X730_27815 [Mesorhizobium sp. L103C565B0]